MRHLSKGNVGGSQAASGPYYDNHPFYDAESDGYREDAFYPNEFDGPAD